MRKEYKMRERTKEDMRREVYFQLALYHYHSACFIESYYKGETYKLTQKQLKDWRCRVALLELMAYRA